MSFWPYDNPGAALWSLTHDGDPRAYALALRHYTFHRYRGAMLTKLDGNCRRNVCAKCLQSTRLWPILEAAGTWRCE